MRLTLTAAAERAGVSRSRLLDALKKGAVKRESDGFYDSAEIDRWDKVRPRRPGKAGAAPGKAAPASKLIAQAPPKQKQDEPAAAQAPASSSIVDLLGRDFTPEELRDLGLRKGAVDIIAKLQTSEEKRLAMLRRSGRLADVGTLERLALAMMRRLAAGVTGFGASVEADLVARGVPAKHIAVAAERASVRLRELVAECEEEIDREADAALVRQRAAGKTWA